MIKTLQDAVETLSQCLTPEEQRHFAACLLASSPQKTDLPEDTTTIKNILKRLHKTQPFKDIVDAVSWQKNVRKERVLPDRQ